MAPVSWNGANTLYHRIIKPFVLKHQKDIDKALDKVGQKVDEVAKEGGLKNLFIWKEHKNGFPFILCLPIDVANVFTQSKPDSKLNLSIK